MSRPLAFLVCVLVAAILGTGAYLATRNLSSPFLAGLINRSGLVLITGGFTALLLDVTMTLVRRAREGVRR